MDQAPDQALRQITDRIRAAFADGTALRLRGGGTKDFYGACAPAALRGEVLDTTPLAGITSYEPSELVVTVRAGTPLAELEAALAEQGQCLPFEPPHFGQGTTVGGMVAAGLSGPARATAGTVRDYVLGLTLVNGKAEHLTFGGTVMKNVAGYDVSRLMAGAMGTLGLITQVSLKVLPVAPAEATLRFALDEATAIRQLNEWAGEPLPLNASSWVMDAGQPVLYLRLRGAVAAVSAACQRLLAQMPGERVEVKSGEVWVEGKRRDGRYPVWVGPLSIEQGRLFADRYALLGDNRSEPSSVMVHAVIPAGEFVGRVVYRFRIWPFTFERVS